MMAPCLIDVLFFARSAKSAVVAYFPRHRVFTMSHGEFFEPLTAKFSNPIPMAYIEGTGQIKFPHYSRVKLSVPHVLMSFRN
jgi:hypothetical protein